MKLAEAIRLGRDYLAETQQSDGSFVGQAGPSIEWFQATLMQPTIFSTALIAACLHVVPQADNLRAAAIEFLLQHKSTAWSWNYWRRDSLQSQDQPYPDDLDDTAYALTALMLHNPKLIDGSALGHFAQLLIATEIMPGSPYGT